MKRPCYRSLSKRQEVRNFCECVPKVRVFFFSSHPSFHHLRHYAETFVEGIQEILLRVRNLVARARDWAADARDALCSRGSAANITRLEKVHADSETLPVRVAEMDAVRSTIEHARNWLARAREVLEKRSEPALMATLVNEVNMIPFLQELPEHEILRRKLIGAAALSERLRDILHTKRNRLAEGMKLSYSKVRYLIVSRLKLPSPLTSTCSPHGRAKLVDIERDVDALGVELKECRALEALSKHVKRWRADASHALAHAPDLKQLQKLIITGEGLPVAFPDYLNELREKLSQAEAWVERVRNAVPRAKTRTNIDVEKVRNKWSQFHHTHILF
jgi:hypothetical protein